MGLDEIVLGISLVTKSLFKVDSYDLWKGVILQEFKLTFKIRKSWTLASFKSKGFSRKKQESTVSCQLQGLKVLDLCKVEDQILSVPCLGPQLHFYHVRLVLYARHCPLGTQVTYFFISSQFIISITISVYYIDMSLWWGKGSKLF